MTAKILCLDFYSCTFDQAVFSLFFPKTSLVFHRANDSIYILSDCIQHEFFIHFIYKTIIKTAVISIFFNITEIYTSVWMERVCYFRIPHSLWIFTWDFSGSSYHCSLIFITFFSQYPFQHYIYTDSVLYVHIHCSQRSRISQRYGYSALLFPFLCDAISKSEKVTQCQCVTKERRK